MHSLPRLSEKNWPKANIPCMEPLGILYYHFINTYLYIYILYSTMAIEIPKMKNMLLALNLAFQLPRFLSWNELLKVLHCTKMVLLSDLLILGKVCYVGKQQIFTNLHHQKKNMVRTFTARLAPRGDIISPFWIGHRSCWEKNRYTHLENSAMKKRCSMVTPFITISVRGCKSCFQGFGFNLGNAQQKCLAPRSTVNGKNLANQLRLVFLFLWFLTSRAVHGFVQPAAPTRTLWSSYICVYAHVCTASSLRYLEVVWNPSKNYKHHQTSWITCNHLMSIHATNHPTPDSVGQNSRW